MPWLAISSLWRPCSATWPCLMTQILSAFWMVDSRCAMTIHVLPSRALSRASCTIWNLTKYKIQQCETFIFLYNSQTGVVSGVFRVYHVRSRYRCSNCPAIDITLCSWLCSSLTLQPSYVTIYLILHIFKPIKIYVIYEKKLSRDSYTIEFTSNGNNSATFIFLMYGM